MAKWYGTIGFAEQVENAPGVWDDSIMEKTYQGDLIKNHVRNQEGPSVNDEFNIDNEISIVGDDYIFDNLYRMRWIELYGTKWKIKSAGIDYPRIKLYVGGVYND